MMANVTDYEQERRSLLLSSGMLTDWRIETSLGSFDLHRTLVAARCHYFFTLLTSSLRGAAVLLAPSPLPPLRLVLPDPLESTDGQWERRDLERLWWHSYATEAQWERDWEEARAAAASVPLTLDALQGWFRLHRLADFVQHEALVRQIEVFLLGPGLASWARACPLEGAEHNGGDPTTFLLPRVQAFSDACAAGGEARARLIHGLRQWLLTFAVSLYARPQSARIEWLDAIGPRLGTDSGKSILEKRDTCVTVLCPACVGPDPDSNVLLGNESSVCTLVRKFRALVFPRTSGSEAFPLSVDYLHWDGTTGHVIWTPAVPYQASYDCSVSAAYMLSAAAAAELPMRTDNAFMHKGHVGRCQRCSSRTSTLHVWALHEQRNYTARSRGTLDTREQMRVE